jgi:predicted unusual protein kinase regulating ubiquinone biosynthesis (AarF/ABC1/UbiB family)
MKAGQMLSVYGEHFLPPEVNQVLKSLQSESIPVDGKEMRKVLVRQLGKETLSRLQVDPEPLRAASLGQVHKARAGSREFVLKIQYPGVDKAVDGDLKALRRILSLTEFLPQVPATDELFAEVGSMLKHELDYGRELAMLEFFRKELKNDGRFVLPEPLPEFSAKRVLAMSLETGAPVDSREVLALSQERRDRLAEAALDLFFRELFVWRKVQTDPHFGNYRIRLRPKGDQWVLYDFGAVRELPETFVQDYRRLLKGMFDHSREAFEAAAQVLGVLEASDPQELKDIFFALCSLIVEPFATDEPYQWGGTDLPKRVSRLSWEIFRKFPLRAPPREVVFLDRKMAGVFTLLSTLDARFNARRVLAPHMR